jgi:hypothetical protein
MKPATSKRARRILSPIDLASEVIYALIMVTTFTATLSVAESGQGAVRTMLFGAIGCSLAWGIVDAVVYLLGKMSQRARDQRLVRMVQSAPDPNSARELISHALSPAVVSVLTQDQFEDIRLRLMGLRRPGAGPRLHRSDWLGAVAILGVVLVATFPIVVPFLLMSNVIHALRLSNAIAIAILFLAGFSIGRYAGERAWQTGLIMVAIGVVLVAITVALGG